MAGPLGIDAAVEFTAAILNPLAVSLEDAELVDLVETLGWRLPGATDGLRLLRGSAADVIGALADLHEARRSGTDDEVLQAVAAVGVALTTFIAALELLPNSFATELAGFPALDDITNNFVKRLLDRLIVDAIGNGSQLTRAILLAVGIIEETPFEEVVGDPDPSKDHPAFLLREIRFDRVSKLITSPTGLLEDLYGWGTPQLNRDRLFKVLQEIAFAFVVGPDIRYASPQFLSALFPGTSPPADEVHQMLSVQLLGLGFPPLAIATIPALKASPTELQGLALLVTGTSAATITTDLSVDTTLTLTADLGLDLGVGVLLRPKQDPTIVQNIAGGGLPTPNGKIAIELRRASDEGPLSLFTFGGGSELTAEQLFAQFQLQIPPPDFAIRAGVTGGKLKVSLQDADGFIGEVMGDRALEFKFDFAIGWSSARGLSLSGSAGLETQLDINTTIGPVLLKSVNLSARASGEGIRVSGGLNAGVTIGPVAASVEGIGVKTDVAFKSGNLGPLDLDASFLAPTGVGIAVNAGPVHGGGFISFEPDLGRYSGAMELSIYDISVKAFGLIETKVPGVSFSFVIVISAEFTPIQLGFGFTLNGVGGLVGINRTINSTELKKLVLEGRSENLLFPKNLIANAPTIIRDLGTVFPARPSHYVFGPLGKLGWGTPTLITGEIGIIIEIPGVVVILGEVKILLPKPDVPLVKMNMSVGGTLDFPNKTFSLEAALHDSIIEGYPISGQMALRVKWGEQPNFVASIGGFHPAYQPPKDFPKLQPMTLDLGQHGKASITVTGFFAVTSNTVQVGGDARLHAGESGIALDASVSVKALFVFSPFQFQATIDASVKISFHGYGPSVHLSGVLEGPAPWHIRGELCVSIVFWDACLGFDETFGTGTPAAVPEIDPWFGAVASGDTPAVTGLQTALQDAGNWSGVTIAGTASVVSRAQGSETLVDPAGGLSVHQKAVPVETDQPISRFGVAKVTSPIAYKLQSATFGTQPAPPTLKTLSPVSDFFAPAQYFQMDDGKKMSAPGFEQKQAGYLFGENDNNLRAGSHAGVTSNYTTYFIAADGTISEPQVDQATNAQVTGQNKRSAVALGGVTQLGTRRFIDRLITQAFDVLPPTFILSSNTSLTAITGGQTPMTRTSALLSLDAHRLQNPGQRFQVQVSALHELA